MKIFENKDTEQVLIDKLTELTQKDGYSITSINNIEECNVCADYTTHTININIELEKKKFKILDKEEKRYLENVLKPFKDKIKCIVKSVCFEDEFIYIVFNDRDDVFEFPLFKKDTMYKGMQLNKGYTIKELGLFE